MFILYLLYGLAFFTLGVAILSWDTKLSELGIARILPLLAIFGVIHGFHEWLELFEKLDPSIATSGFLLFRLIIVSLSFLFLLYFGLFLNIITIFGDHALKTTPTQVKVMVGVAALFLIFLATYMDYGTNQGQNVRRFVAFPGGLLSGIGLILYSRTVLPFSLDVARNFILAGVFMCCYAILTGILPSDIILPVIGQKIILLRGISAFLIMLFTIRGLSVFNIEQRKLIDEKLLRFSQSEKLTSMGILAAGIAHEINNPLTNVQLNVEMLKDHIKSDPVTDRRISAIVRNLDRASKIAKELLHFSREKETDLLPIDINEILHSTKSLLSSQANSSILSFDLQKVAKIQGIPWKLEEVFVNILMNSFDACTGEDAIEVLSYQEHDRLRTLEAFNIKAMTLFTSN